MDIAYIDIFRQLSRICLEISKGDYRDMDQLFKLTQTGEYPEFISGFSESFGLMLVKLQAREFELTNTIKKLKATQVELEAAKQKLQEENIYLKRQIKEFNIVIDKKKKEKQVSQITESDIFQEILKLSEDIRKNELKNANEE